MASSLPLQGGSTTVKTVKESITQVDHGFEVGDVIRWDPTLVKYVKAQADSAINAEVIGVVNFKESSAAFQITYSGNIELTDGKFTGVSAAPVLFLSAGVSGGLQTSPPSTIGSVVKPVLTKTKGNSYLVHNFLGTQIGGSSTISVDEIQPVGTIMPFAGSVIPDTWLLCDGNPQNRTAYPELFSKLCYTDGDQVPMYGYVAGITGSGTAWNSIRQNDILHFRSNGTSPWGVAEPYGINAGDDIRAQVVGVPSASNMYFQLRIIPKYEAVQLGSGATQRTLSRFQFPNKLFASGSAIAGNYRVFQGADGTLPLRVGPTSTQFTVTQVIIQQFLTPDLRGRFALGTSSVTDTARGEENETEPTFISSLGTYSMGSLGGEEAHTLTSGEMPSHNHAATIPEHDHFLFALGGGNQRTFFGPGNYGGTTPQNQNDVMRPIGNGQGDNTNFEYSITSGGNQSQTNRSGKTFKSDATNVNTNNAGNNSAHNNMPPYLAVRYIIKAKPYTRAAIIDGVDIPYSSLLVRDLRSELMGASAVTDLQICTNSNSTGQIGTERIRIKGDNGFVGIGKMSPASELDVNGTGIFTKVGVGVSSIPTVALDVNGITRFTGSVGVNTASPSVALDIVGEARSSISTTDTSNAKTLVTKDYLQSFTRIGSVVMGVLTQGQTSNIFGNSVQCSIRTTNDTVTITFPTGTSWSGFAARNSDGGAFGGSANGPGFAGLTTFTNTNSFTATGVTESNTRVILFAIRTV